MKPLVMDGRLRFTRAQIDSGTAQRMLNTIEYSAFLSYSPYPGDAMFIETVERCHECNGSMTVGDYVVWGFCGDCALFEALTEVEGD